MKTLLEKGDWGHSTYDAYLDLGGDLDRLRGLTTAAVSICLNEEGKIVLTQHKDGGWDLLGGKTEPLEVVEETLKREALEEGGMELSSWKYFGHYEGTPSEDKDEYPDTFYIPFFISRGKKVCEPYGEEVMGAKAFTIEEIQEQKILSDHVMLREAIRVVQSVNDK